MYLYMYIWNSILHSNIHQEYRYIYFSKFYNLCYLFTSAAFIGCNSSPWKFRANPAAFPASRILLVSSNPNTPFSQNTSMLSTVISLFFISSWSLGIWQLITLLVASSGVLPLWGHNFKIYFKNSLQIRARGYFYTCHVTHWFIIFG